MLVTEPFDMYTRYHVHIYVRYKFTSTMYWLGMPLTVTVLKGEGGGNDRASSP